MRYSVYLLSSPLPHPFSLWKHAWFVVELDGDCQRWEVWQSANASSGLHVRRDLMKPWQGIRKNYWGRESFRAAMMHQWHGDQDSIAGFLYTLITESSSAYPWRDRYSYWPGPNSNTYVSYILRKAGYTDLLDWRCAGKDYHYLFGTPS